MCPGTELTSGKTTKPGTVPVRLILKIFPEITVLSIPEVAPELSK